MKYCLANRGNILNQIKHEDLKAAGIDAVELYYTGNPYEFIRRQDQLRAIQDIFEVAISITEEIDPYDFELLEQFIDLAAIQLDSQKEINFIIRPCCIYKDKKGRFPNRSRTNAITGHITRRHQFEDNLRFCLQNQRFSPKLPYLYGDNLKEVTSTAYVDAHMICLNICNLLSGRGTENYIDLLISDPSITHPFIGREGYLESYRFYIPYVQVSGYVRGKPNRPLWQDDGSTTAILRRLKDSLGHYATFSLDVDFYRSPSPVYEVYDSLERLRTILE